MMYLSIVLAAVVAMIIGHLGYGPLFGKRRMKLTDMKKKDMKKGNMAQVMLIALVNSLVMMYVLHYMTMNFTDGTMQGALMGAFWVWLGFLLTQQVSTSLRSKNGSLELVMINGLYRLVVVLVAAILFVVI